MTISNNPMPDPLAPTIPSAPPADLPITPRRVPIENPPWSGWDVVFLTVSGFLTIIVSVLGVSYGANRFVYPAKPWIEVVRYPELIVASQLVAYVAFLGIMYGLVAVHRQGFFKAIHWNWPKPWGWYVFGGLVMSVVLQLFARLLPIPKDLPMDQFFRTSRQAWMLSIFSVTLAPLIEELFFRGFLYPVLARRLGMATSVFLTALAFASIHGEQLTYAWGPVLIIFIVGLVLSTVRAITKSVAASVLMHVAYNGTIAVAMFIGTSGFTHLERLRQ